MSHTDENTTAFYIIAQSDCRRKKARVRERKRGRKEIMIGKSEENSQAENNIALLKNVISS